VGRPARFRYCLHPRGNSLSNLARSGDRVQLRELRFGHALAAATRALVLLAIWWNREAIDFNVLLPGLAWRIWLVLHDPVGPGTGFAT
jgi:hypothetical protein